MKIKKYTLLSLMIMISVATISGDSNDDSNTNISKVINPNFGEVINANNEIEKEKIFISCPKPYHSQYNQDQHHNCEEFKRHIESILRNYNYNPKLMPGSIRYYMDKMRKNPYKYIKYFETSDRKNEETNTKNYLKLLQLPAIPETAGMKEIKEYIHSNFSSELEQEQIPKKPYSYECIKFIHKISGPESEQENIENYLALLELPRIENIDNFSGENIN